MIHFDCLDGLEADINFGNASRKRQLEQSATGKVGNTKNSRLQERSCRPHNLSQASLAVQDLYQGQTNQTTSPSSVDQQVASVEPAATSITLAGSLENTDDLLSFSPTSSSIQQFQTNFFSKPLGSQNTTTTSCCVTQTQDITSMSSTKPTIDSRSTINKTDTANINSTRTTLSSPTIVGENGNILSCLLITANVGTIFEEANLLELWFLQLKDYLIKIKPRLVAIHCQEVGGKNFESSMKNVSSFTDKILGDDEIIRDYSRVRIFLDDDFERLEKFTALGSLYLIHDSVESVRLYNFESARFDYIQDRVISRDNHNHKNCNNNVVEQQNNILPANRTSESNNNNIETPSVVTKNQVDTCEHVEKIKFPSDLFPECRWSRKGFMRTRWLFNGSQLLDLVNIHLFHDASNLIAMEKTPSPYAQKRQRALEFALEHLSKPLENQNLPEVPMFIFGDFNFRLDTNKVIEKITNGILPVVKRKLDSDEVVEIVYHRKSSLGTASESMSEDSLASKQAASRSLEINENSNEGIVMTVGKKLFDCENLDEMFRATKNTEWLQELDIELDSFRGKLYEFKISFSPSYPFREDESGGYSYMKTRCPAWCDRILFNDAGRRLIFGRSRETEDGPNSESKIELLQNQGDVIYRLMGNSVPMGDHKPVLLYCQLELSEGQAGN